MKSGIAFLGFFTIFSMYPEVVNQATFHTPDGTQIVLLAEEHTPITKRDADQVNSLTQSIKEWAESGKKPVHVMLEEPSADYKASVARSAQDVKKWHPSGIQTYQNRMYQPPSVTLSLKSRIKQLRIKAIRAENAEIRSASGAARVALIRSDRGAYPQGKFDAKKPFESRKLSVWTDTSTMLLNDVYNELKESLESVEQRTTADKIRIQRLQSQLSSFKDTYQELFPQRFQSIAQSMNEDERAVLYRKIEAISDAVFEQYLLARVLKKSSKSNVVLVAGRDHIGILRSLLQKEACFLLAFKQYSESSDGTIKMDQYQLSRLNTLYLQLVRLYLKGKRKLVFHAKQLRLRFKKC